MASTRRADTEPPSKLTSAPTPSVSIEVTSHPSRTSAPAAHATAASSSVNAPIPPTGTSQSPVPLPITWYRKQRFWRSDSSSSPANVPISASVPTIPRSKSSSKYLRSTCPSGRSKSASHAARSPTRARICARERSGSVNVGNTACATRAVSSSNAAQLAPGG